MVIKSLVFLVSFFGSVQMPTHNLSQANLSEEFLVAKKEEMICMAQVIYDEARGEPYKGKVAVAAVVMNRVRHKKFPNAVCKVVYQKRSNVCQFSGMCKKGLKKYDNESLELAFKVVVMNEYEDPTKGSTYFHNLSVSPYWSKKYEKTSRIGNHVFYRN